MQETDVLQRIRERASQLVAQNLRSASVVLGHMRELIVEAHGIGHGHKAIHAALEAAGLRASWNTYKSCLMRMKKATRTLPSSSATATPKVTPSLTSGSPLKTPNAASPMQPGAAVADESATLCLAASSTHDVNPSRSASSTTSSATRVLDALIEARKVASRDYAQIARDLHRQQQRAPSRKDLP
jgi:hypothetical protein